MLPYILRRLATGLLMLVALSMLVFVPAAPGAGRPHRRLCQS